MQGPFQGPAEKVDQGLAGLQAFVHGRRGNVQARFDGRNEEVGTGSVGLVQQRQDEHAQERLPGKLAFAEDKTRLPRQVVEVIAELLLQGSSDGLYNVQAEAPSSHQLLVATSVELGAFCVSVP